MIYDIPNTAKDMLAEDAAAEYLKFIGKLNDNRIERWHQENSAGLYSLNEFVEAVYRLHGNDL